jgi:hypothetical protein
MRPYASIDPGMGGSFNKDFIKNEEYDSVCLGRSRIWTAKVRMGMT